jgi:hypothetical protein
MRSIEAEAAPALRENARQWATSRSSFMLSRLKVPLIGGELPFPATCSRRRNRRPRKNSRSRGVSPRGARPTRPACSSLTPKAQEHGQETNVVKYQLKPILKKLGIPSKDVGLHAFRHALATELADAAVPLPVLQTQMRHADVRTTLKSILTSFNSRSGMRWKGSGSQSVQLFRLVQHPPLSCL